MSLEWKMCRLGDFITLRRGFDLPIQDRKEGRVPVISSSGRTGLHERSTVKGPGVVTGRYGTIGQVFYVEEDFWPLNTTLYVSDFHGNDPEFVACLLRTIDFLAHSDKSSVPGVNRNHLHTTEIYVPVNVSEQKAIADSLGVLTRKIELNQRMNQTLEAIANAIFKSWFVDFDPVRAKAADSSLNSELMKLFPSTFVETELGAAPCGWRLATLGTLCRRVAMGPFGSDIKTDNFVDSGVPVIRGANLKSGFVDEGFVYLTNEKADELRHANAYPDDIVITHRGTLGQVGIIPRESSFPRYVVSQSQLVVSVDSNLATPRFVFEFLRSADGQHQLLSNTSQTGVPAIARPTTSVKAMRLILPPIELLTKFQSLIESLATKQIANNHQSRTLLSIRDTILPKLMSGAIRVKTAETIVEANA